MFSTSLMKEAKCTYSICSLCCLWTVFFVTNKRQTLALLYSFFPISGNSCFMPTPQQRRREKGASKSWYCKAAREVGRIPCRDGAGSPLTFDAASGKSSVTSKVTEGQEESLQGEDVRSVALDFWEVRKGGYLKAVRQDAPVCAHLGQQHHRCQHSGHAILLQAGERSSYATFR